MKPRFLDIRYTPINIFSVSKLKNEFIELKNVLLTVNSVWRDVQVLNSFSRCIIDQLQDEKNDIFECLFSGLGVLTKDFYVHFSVIYKLLEKICKKNKIFDNFFNSFKKNIGENIQILRNEVILHQEKPNFRKTYGSSFDTSHGGLYINLYTKNGDFELKPFIDSKIIEDELLKLKKLIEK